MTKRNVFSTKYLTGSAVAIALLATSVTPAYAGWGGGGWGHGRHHDDHIDAGDVIAGIFIIGAIAAIAGGSKKRNRDRGYPQDQGNDGLERGATQNRGKIASENEAVDACANAVESRMGNTASVRDISEVKADSDGWDVEGTVEKRSGWRDRSAQNEKFTCSVRFGRVEHVYVEDANVT
jgi:hypothetical protein